MPRVIRDDFINHKSTVTDVAYADLPAQTLAALARAGDKEAVAALNAMPADRLTAAARTETFYSDDQPRDEHGRFGPGGGGEGKETTTRDGEKTTDLSGVRSGQPMYNAVQKALDKVEPDTAIRLANFEHNSGYRAAEAVAIRDEHGLTVIRETSRAADTQATGAYAYERVSESHAAVVAAFDGNRDTAQQVQGTYVVLSGRNPDDAYFAEKYATPGFKAGASADGNGHLTAWNDKYPSVATATHEAGHNLDAFLGRPSDMEWKDASRDDRVSNAQLLVDHGGSYQLDAQQPSFPALLSGAATTSYGKSSPREDFAEAFRLFGAEKLSADLRVTMADGYRPTFHDAFPHRAEILDVGVDHAQQMLRA